MAIALAQAWVSASGSGTSVGVALGGNTTAGNLVVACTGAGDGGPDFTNITDGQSNSWTIGPTATNGGAQVQATLSYLENCPGGNIGTLTANFSASQFSSNIGVGEYSGIATASALDQSNTGSAGSGTVASTANITTTENDELVIGAAIHATAFATWLQGGSFTERADTGAGRTFTAGEQILSSTATLNYSATESGASNVWAAVVASFKAAAATVTYEQEGFRWRFDDGNETGATWIAAQDTSITRAATLPARLRVLIDTTNDAPTTQVGLQYRKVGDPTSEWRLVI